MKNTMIKNGMLIIGFVLSVLPAVPALAATDSDEYLRIGKAYSDSYETNKTAEFIDHKNTVCREIRQNTDDGSCDQYLDAISARKEKFLPFYAANRRIPYYQDFIHFMDLYEKATAAEQPLP